MTHPVHLTLPELRSILQGVMQTVPAEGKAMTGVLAGVEWSGTRAQYAAFQEAKGAALRLKRRMARMGVAA